MSGAVSGLRSWHWTVDLVSVCRGPYRMAISVTLGWNQTACRFVAGRVRVRGTWAVAVSAGVVSEHPPSTRPGVSTSFSPAGCPGAWETRWAKQPSQPSWRRALARLGLSGGGVITAMFLRSSICSVAFEFVFWSKSPHRLSAGWLGAAGENSKSLSAAGRTDWSGTTLRTLGGCLSEMPSPVTHAPQQF